MHKNLYKKKVLRLVNLVKLRANQWENKSKKKKKRSSLKKSIEIFFFFKGKMGIETHTVSKIVDISLLTIKRFLES